MRTSKLFPLGAALCAIVLTLAGGAHAAGDKAAYDGARATAKSTYETTARQCDVRSGNARDICIAEAKAARARAEAAAEAAYKKTTPKGRENARTAIAEADYKVARERCDERAGNDKDVCIKVAKAGLTKARADAKASRKVSEARSDAAKDKLDADYSVAAAKCDAMNGDAKSACISQARARYGK